VSELTSRQQEILDAVLKIISETGLQDVSFRNIAKHIGISEPAIYRHFESKDEMFVRLISYLTASIAGRFKDYDIEKGTAIDVMERICLEFIEKVVKKWPMLFTLISAGVFQTKPVLLKELTATIGMSVDLLEQILRRGQKEQVIRKDASPRELAWIYLGSFQFTIQNWNISGQRGDLLKDWRKLQKNLRTLITA